MEGVQAALTHQVKDKHFASKAFRFESASALQSLLPLLFGGALRDITKAYFPELSVGFLLSGGLQSEKYTMQQHLRDMFPI